MIRLFLDANVLFTAAHNPSGKASLIIELASAGYWEVVTSSYAMEEARRNINIKFPDSLKRFESLIASVRKVPAKTGESCPVALPEKDRPIFEAAIRCNATHLLTGDVKDFGPFMNKPNQTSGIIIQTVSEFLASLSRSTRK